MQRHGVVMSRNFPGAMLAAALWLLAPAGDAAAHDGEKLARQRLLYQDARHALALGRIHRYRRLKARLTDYPLYPYLEYAELVRRLNRARPAEVAGFIERHRGTPLARRLHQKWLLRLARRGHWRTFLRHYRPSDEPLLRCYAARAWLHTGHRERAFAAMAELWPTGRSLPRACDPVIRAWHRSGGLDDARVWERVRLALRHGRPRLAWHLRRYLSPGQRHWLDLWRRVRRNPRLEFNDPRRPEEARIARWIRADALVRLARTDAVAAARRWQAWRGRYPFAPHERQRIERHLALALLKRDEAEAQRWLEELSLARADLRVQESYIVTALQDEDWATALAWMDRLPLEQRHSERWRYWRGRALEALGRLEEARSTFLLNVAGRGYYAFLSADHLGMPYRIQSQPLRFSDEELHRLHDIPAVARARELFLVNDVVNARREWHHALAGMDRARLLMAAQLAAQWGWHDRAIVAFGQAAYWDDLERRFPLAHRELVLEQSRRFGINPAWAFAVIRQESGFTRDARSHAGALGLMQLLPHTARQLARSLRVRLRSRRDLLRVDTNVRLGVGYLKRMRDRFAGHKVLATAAYNAGSLRVRQWLPQARVLPADVWVESVPLDETRGYLRRVLGYTIIYEQRLGLPPRPLLERMGPVGRPPVAGTGQAPASRAG